MTKISPTENQSHKLQLRVGESVLEKLDELRRREAGKIPSRADMFRRLVERAHSQGVTTVDDGSGRKA